MRRLDKRDFDKLNNDLDNDNWWDYQGDAQKIMDRIHAQKNTQKNFLLQYLSIGIALIALLISVVSLIFTSLKL